MCSHLTRHSIERLFLIEVKSSASVAVEESGEGEIAQDVREESRERRHDGRLRTKGLYVADWQKTKGGMSRVEDIGMNTTVESELRRL